MTRLPTEASLQALIDSARALYQKPRDRRLPDPTLLAAIERRLLRAVQRDRTGTTDRDGYPGNTLGSGTPTSNGSSTETHALGRPERDRHHELTILAVQHLEQLVLSANVIVSALNSIDDLTSDQGPAPRTCAACTGHRLQGGDRSDVTRGTMGDRLERATDLCRACMDFVRSSAPAGSHAGVLPTPEQIRWHDSHGRWRLRVTDHSQISNAG